MRRSLAAFAIAVAACGPAPSPSATPSTPAPPTGTPELTAFSFDVENNSSVSVVVSVASDAAATMHGLEPGQRGTISIPLRNLHNGIGVEIQGVACRHLGEAGYTTEEPFTMLVEDGPEPGTIELATREGASTRPIPLPSNSLFGCGG